MKASILLIISEHFYVIFLSRNKNILVTSEVEHYFLDFLYISIEFCKDMSIEKVHSFLFLFFFCTKLEAKQKRIYFVLSRMCLTYNNLKLSTISCITKDVFAYNM